MALCFPARLTMTTTSLTTRSWLHLETAWLKSWSSNSSCNWLSLGSGGRSQREFIILIFIPYFKSTLCGSSCSDLRIGQRTLYTSQVIQLFHRTCTVVISQLVELLRARFGQKLYGNAFSHFPKKKKRVLFRAKLDLRQSRDGSFREQYSCHSLNGVRRWRFLLY